MRRGRKTKIVATLGPASSSQAMVATLFEAGADVFRINMSHTSHDAMRQLVSTIRGVEGKFERPIGILVDLQGPKLRLGEFADGTAELLQGAEFALDSDTMPGDGCRVHVPHPEVLSALQPGHTILIDDGKLRLEVMSCSPTRVICETQVGGRIASRKGISLPDTTLPVGAMTAKDRSDLEAAVNEDIDWVAISFVQRPEDVAEVRKLARGRALVMSKIEKPNAVTRLDEIVEASDAIMVARGDLGVEMPVEKVPGVQKRATRLARRLGKPVVIATQMLESMIASPVPTRAEVSDVATAVFEGADAVMLSAESAAGAYPGAAVAMMDRVAREIEADPSYLISMQRDHASPEATGADAIAAAARGTAETLNLPCIIAWTASGATTFRLSRERPSVPILSLTPLMETARRLSIIWGTHALRTDDVRDIDDMVTRGCRMALAEGFAEYGQRVILVAGMPFGTPGATNMMRIGFVQKAEQTDFLPDPPPNHRPSSIAA